MNKRELQKGDIVQIGPIENGFFTGCLMMVTESFSWGAQGFVAVPGERGTIPNRAYTRVKFEDMEYVGKASFVPVDLDDE
jgi:hypothetical protein